MGLDLGQGKDPFRRSPNQPSGVPIRPTLHHTKPERSVVTALAHNHEPRSCRCGLKLPLLPPTTNTIYEKPPLTLLASCRHTRPCRPPTRCTVATKNTAPLGSPQLGKERLVAIGTARALPGGAHGWKKREKGLWVWWVGFSPPGRNGGDQGAGQDEAFTSYFTIVCPTVSNKLIIVSFHHRGMLLV
jgi:hypothetical protein